MQVRASRLVLAMAAITWMAVAPLAGKPNNVPVTVEFAVPQNMKTGEEVETVLGFRALSDIDQLDVAVAPFRGLALVSEASKATFTDVGRGTAPELRVRVRLSDPQWGSLAVTYRARTAGGTAASAITIVYGNPK